MLVTCLTLVVRVSTQHCIEMFAEKLADIHKACHNHGAHCWVFLYSAVILRQHVRSDDRGPAAGPPFLLHRWNTRIQYKILPESLCVRLLHAMSWVQAIIM